MNASVQLPVITLNNEFVKSGLDNIAVEEPVEIRMAYGSNIPSQVKILAVTMRTPGHDEELAIGFMFTEGIISGYKAIKNTGHVFAACSVNKQNIIEVTLHPEIVPNLLHAERN